MANLENDLFCGMFLAAEWAVGGQKAQRVRFCQVIEDYDAIVISVTIVLTSWKYRASSQ